MSNRIMVPFTPLTERIATELPELSEGLHKLELMMGEHDFNKYINSLIRLRKSGDMLLLITGKAMYYSIIEKEFLPMIKESFEVTKVRVISQ